MLSELEINRKNLVRLMKINKRYLLKHKISIIKETVCILFELSSYWYLTSSVFCVTRDISHISLFLISSLIFGGFIFWILINHIIIRKTISIKILLTIEIIFIINTIIYSNQVLSL